MLREFVNLINVTRRYIAPGIVEVDNALARAKAAVILNRMGMDASDRKWEQEFDAIMAWEQITTQHELHNEVVIDH